MAAARAEARRKAILARGSDRLSKLTTSARGEDHPVYAHDDPPVPSVQSNLRNFVGEDTAMPAPPSSTSRSSTPAADPSAWSQEQQRQFMQAIMGGAGTTPGGSPLPGMPALPTTPGGGFNFDPAAAGANGSDPFSALMTQFSQQQPGAPTAPAAPPKPPTLVQKLMPLLHLLSVWLLLAFFVLAKEPVAWSNGGGQWGLGWEVDRDGPWWGMWRRWGELARTAGRGATGSGIGGYAVQAVPFFWAFLALQMAIHSARIFTGIDKVQPPMLLSLALPYLPAPLPTLIINALKYVKMGGFFLDDVAALIVGLGLLVWLGGWVQQ